MLSKDTRIIVGDKYAFGHHYSRIIGEQHIVKKFLITNSGSSWYELKTTDLYIRAEDAIPIKIENNMSAAHLLHNKEA